MEKLWKSIFSIDLTRQVDKKSVITENWQIRHLEFSLSTNIYLRQQEMASMVGYPYLEVYNVNIRCYPQLTS